METLLLQDSLSVILETWVSLTCVTCSHLRILLQDFFTHITIQVIMHLLPIQVTSSALTRLSTQSRAVVVTSVRDKSCVESWSEFSCQILTSLLFYISYSIISMSLYKKLVHHRTMIQVIHLLLSSSYHWKVCTFSSWLSQYRIVYALLKFSWCSLEVLLMLSWCSSNSICLSITEHISALLTLSVRPTGD